MEERTLDKKSIIGFVLMALIMMVWLYLNQPTEAELAEQQEKQKQEQLAAEKENQVAELPVVKPTLPQVDTADSISMAQYQSRVGRFAATAVKEGSTVLENDLLRLVVDHRGGQIIEAKLKNFVDHDSVPIYLINEGNANFDIQFSTSDNRVLSTSELYFEPEVSQNDGNRILTLRAKAGPSQFLEYQYSM